MNIEGIVELLKDRYPAAEISTGECHCRFFNLPMNGLKDVIIITEGFEIRLCLLAENIEPEKVFRDSDFLVNEAHRRRLEVVNV